MNKKMVAMLLSMTMCASMFVGCANREEQKVSSTETKTQTSETTSTVVEEPQETVNIVVYNRANAQNSDKAIVDAMNAYSEEKIGVTITYVPIPSSEYKDKLSMENCTMLCLKKSGHLQSMQETDTLFLTTRKALPAILL